MTEKFSLILTFLILLSKSIAVFDDSAFSCIDEGGVAVDWWILYKLPKSKDEKSNNNGNLLSEGLAYMYLSSNTPNSNWTLSSISIDDKASMPGRTLQNIYRNTDSDGSDNIFSLMYNDEHPHGPTSFTKGHTKGLVLGNITNSIWLIHSVPHYPPPPNETYGYPSTGKMYGQTAICISIDTNSTLDSIGRQLRYNLPYTYHTDIPSWLGNYPEMTKAANGKHIKKAPFSNVENIQTMRGRNFTIFAKSSNFNKDLYADLVAPVLKVPLLVETWPNGPGKMPSRCNSPYIVENVYEINLTATSFKTTHDHAKWAISSLHDHPFICIGDINRLETQRKRGGGTACFSNDKVWNAFKKSISIVEECDQNPF